MKTYELVTPASETEWNTLTSHLSGRHILQSYAWAEVKKSGGWIPEYLVWKDEQAKIIAAIVIHHKLVPGLGRIFGHRLMYSPRGPILDWKDKALREGVLADLRKHAIQQKALFFKLDPEIPVGWGVPLSLDEVTDSNGQEIQSSFSFLGWKFSQDQLQFRNTVLLDISGDEEPLIQSFKQKTRYNIRLAAKKGVVVRLGELADLPHLYQMYAQTAVRDGFIIRSSGYYLETWKQLMQQGLAYPLIAEVEGNAVAALMLFIYADRAYYFYGMSTTQYRDYMPNYLLQWEAIRLAKQQGCTTYDFWGAPDDFASDEGMSGVFKFKEGFNGRVFRGIGAWDFAPNQVLYQLYTQIMPAILNGMRWFGRRRISQEAKE